MDMTAAPGTLPVPRYAVVFKTHVWDAFIQRQFDRYRAAIGTGDLFACIDDTGGRVGPIEAPALRFVASDLVALGLADRAERGQLVWWNTDYPHYLFQERYPGYDYYLFVEYDTCIQRGLDGLMAEVAAAGADFVALPTRTPKQDWMWTPFHLGTYDYETLTGSLNCISIFSAPALRLLGERRREMSRQSAGGGVPFWPINEVFLASEIRRAGLAARSLDAFGGADGYEWYPPHLEDDLAAPGAPPGTAAKPAPGSDVFLHPVLDRDRYMASLLKFSPLPSYFIPQTRLGRGLRRFPQFYPKVPRAFLARLAMRGRERAQDLAARWRARMVPSGRARPAVDATR